MFTRFILILLISSFISLSVSPAYAEECNTQAYLDEIVKQLEKEIDPSVNFSEIHQYQFRMSKSGEISNHLLSKEQKTNYSPQDTLIIDTIKKLAPYPAPPSCLMKNKSERLLIFKFKNRIEASFLPIPKKPDYTPFMEEVKKKISHNWRPPAVNSDDQIKVQFNISKSGSISNLKIVKPSQTEAGNEAIIKAIETSAPFSNYPKGDVLDKILVEFTFGYGVIPQKPFSHPNRKSDRLIKIKALQNKDILNSWINSFKTQVKAKWDYALPKTIKPVVLNCTITHEGNLKQCKKVNSSGEKKKDKSAIKALKESAPFPPFPDNFKDESIELEIKLF